MQSNPIRCKKTKRVATKQGQSIYKSIMRREGKEERKKKKKKERIDANVLQNWVSFKKVVDGWFGKYNVGLEFYIVNLLVHIDNSTRAIVQILFWATSK